MLRDPRMALGLLVLAAAVAHGLEAADPGPPRSADERAYLALATAFERGSLRPPGMDDPAHWGPGTPAVFAVALQLGASPYVPQAVVGVLLVLAGALLAWRAAGPWWGVAVGATLLAYPPLRRASGDALSEPLGALLLVLVLAGAVAVVGRPALPRAAGLGALLGVTVLVRADALVLLPVLALLLALLVGGRRGLACGGTALVAALVVLAPWTAALSDLRGRLTPVTTASSSTLWVGTSLPADGRLVAVRRLHADEARRHNPRLAGVPTREMRTEWIIDAVAARRPDLGRDAALRAEAMANLRRYALGKPVAYAGMTARKLWRMWSAPTRGSLRAARPAETWLHRVLVVAGLAGLALGLVRRRRDPLLLAATVVLVTSTLLTIVFVAEARHGLRLLPLLLITGAVGLAPRPALSRRP